MSGLQSPNLIQADTDSRRCTASILSECWLSNSLYDWLAETGIGSFPKLSKSYKFIWVFSHPQRSGAFFRRADPDSDLAEGLVWSGLGVRTWVNIAKFHLLFGFRNSPCIGSKMSDAPHFSSFDAHLHFSFATDTRKPSSREPRAVWTGSVWRVDAFQALVEEVQRN